MSLLYFDPRLSAINNLQTIHICAYFLYIRPVASNLCSCNRVQHTTSIMYIYRNWPLFHPCKTTANHVMRMVQFDIFSHSHKNLCLVEEDPWVTIVSLYVCTSREPWCFLWSHYHKNMTPFRREKIACIFWIFFWSLDM